MSQFGEIYTTKPFKFKSKYTKKIKDVKWFEHHRRKSIVKKSTSIQFTGTRPQVGSSGSYLSSLDDLPIINRSLINYENYHKFIGHSGVKHAVAIQATRGCPYKCFYCDIYKTAPTHYRRSVKNLIDEVKILADIGFKRFEFIDDIFNVNVKHCTEFFESILKEKLKLKFFFPTGLKGDLLTKELIDLMVESGAIVFNLSLEHASPRMQKVMKKNLDLVKFKENIQYIATKYPHVNLSLSSMHGFPGETKKEAMMTIDYIKSIKWIDWPFLHNVKIFPGTEIEHYALEHGVSPKDIEDSMDQSYHERSKTMPFPAEFTSAVRTIFLRDYVLNRERLLHLVPYQLEYFSEDELNQKYKSYFLNKKINTLDDVLKIVRIDKSEVEPKKWFDESEYKIENIKERIKKKFPVEKKNNTKLNLLLIDLSATFTNEEEEKDTREYNVVEPPLGLMALLTFINKQDYGSKINAKIYKAHIDFNNCEELLKIIKDFKPDIIGFRTMTFYKDLFHDVMKFIRKKGYKTPIIVGGPYPTASYKEALKDKNIDAAVVAEGEITLGEILKKTLSKKEFPNINELQKIKGIAFHSSNKQINKH